jgi:hypothetical protein
MKASFKAAKSNDEVFKKTRRDLIAAAQGAVKDAAAQAVKEGRAHLATAGFSAPRWQRGLTSKFLKQNPEKPARLVFHRLGFLSVFEQGATIAGKPLLWVPIKENLPGKVHSPRQYRRKMSSVTIGGTPFLFSPQDPKKFLFVGVRQVRIRRRLRLRAIFERAAAKLPEFLRERLQRLVGKD